MSLSTTIKLYFYICTWCATVQRYTVYKITMWLYNTNSYCKATSEVIKMVSTPVPTNFLLYLFLWWLLVVECGKLFGFIPNDQLKWPNSLTAVKWKAMLTTAIPYSQAENIVNAIKEKTSTNLLIQFDFIMQHPST